MKCILLIAPLALFAAGCSQSPEAEEKPGAYIYFKEQQPETAKASTTGYWKTLPEGRYLRFAYADAYNEDTVHVKAIYKDTVYILQTVKWEMNHYGLEWRGQSGAFEDAIWLISFNEGYDTLRYTSPEYPPLNSWNAVRIDAEEFERKRQEVLLNRYLEDAACPPEAVSGSRLTYDLAGRWKLIKDTGTGADYSCSEVIFDFQPGHTLAVTSNHPDYPSSVHDYSYEACECWYEPYHPKSHELRIDGKPAPSEVMEKTMLLGDALSPAYKVFIRIG